MHVIENLSKNALKTLEQFSNFEKSSELLNVNFHFTLVLDKIVPSLKCGHEDSKICIKKFPDDYYFLCSKCVQKPCFNGGELILSVDWEM